MLQQLLSFSELATPLQQCKTQFITFVTVTRWFQQMYNEKWAHGQHLSSISGSKVLAKKN